MKNKSLSVSITTTFSSLIIFIISLGTFLSLSISVNQLKDMSFSYTETILKEVSLNIDTYVTSMINITEFISSNEDIILLTSDMQADDWSSDDSSGLIEKFQTYTHTICSINPEILNISLFSLNNNVVFSDSSASLNEYSNYRITDWFLRPLSYTQNAIISPPHVQNIIKYEYFWSTSISKSIIDPSTDKVLGVIVVDLNYSVINDIINTIDFREGGYMYLTDSTNNIIYHPLQKLLYSGIKTEYTFNVPYDDVFEVGTTSYISHNSNVTNWNYIGVIDEAGISTEKSNIILMHLLIGFASITLALFFSHKLSKFIIRPIVALESDIKKVSEGDFSIRSSVNVENEIGSLSKSFNKMTFDIQNLMTTLIENQEKLRESEIKTLQAQINPHFLYNTLESIIWLSASNKNEDVVEITSAFSKLLRSSIGKGNRFIPLKEELNNIKSYLRIQRVRYGSVLSFDICCDESLYEISVPSLILQPIVENALYHGIKPSGNDGFIDIKCAIINDYLEISIIDDGVGADLDAINTLINSNDCSSHIGVKNVHDRIKLLFGDDGSLSYFSQNNSGTTAIIRIPLR